MGNTKEKLRMGYTCNLSSINKYDLKSSVAIPCREPQKPNKPFRALLKNKEPVLKLVSLFIGPTDFSEPICKADLSSE